ncbi:hypothetical protein NBRC10513_002544 [Rhodotorula toruloides]
MTKGEGGAVEWDQVREEVREEELEDVVGDVVGSGHGSVVVGDLSGTNSALGFIPSPLPPPSASPLIDAGLAFADASAVAIVANLVVANAFFVVAVFVVAAVAGSESVQIWDVRIANEWRLGWRARGGLLGVCGSVGSDGRDGGEEERAEEVEFVEG